MKKLFRQNGSEDESESELSANQKTHFKSVSNLDQEKSPAGTSTTTAKNGLAWEDIAKQNKTSDRYVYRFICLMFSFVKIMLFYGCSFLGFFCLGINYHSIVSAERLPEEKGTWLHLAECGMGVTLKARLMIPLPLPLTPDQNFLSILNPLTTLLLSLPSLV